jgi:hypothetical protein
LPQTSSAEPGDTRAGARIAFYGVRLFSQAGQTLFLAALLVAAGTSHAGALGVSNVLAAKLAAAVICGLPGGILADRLGPGRALALGSALRLPAILLALVVIGQPPYIWTAAFLYSACSQLFGAAEMASVPIVRSSTSSRAHSLLVALQYAGQAAGALLVPLVFLLGGPRLMLVAAAVTYVPAVLLAGLFALRTGQLRSAPATQRQRGFSIGWAWRFFARERPAGYALGLLAFTDLALKGTAVAVPLYLTGVLGLDGWQIAVVFVAGGASAGAAMLWSIRGFSTERAAHLMRLSLAGAVVALIGLVGLTRGLGEAARSMDLTPVAAVTDGPVSAFALALLLAPVLGFCIGIAPIAARSVLTDSAPAGQQARVFASQGTVSQALVVAPLLLAGFGTEQAGAQATLAAIGALGLALFLALELGHRRPRPRLMTPALATAEIGRD